MVVSDDGHIQLNLKVLSFEYFLKLCRIFQVVCSTALHNTLMHFTLGNTRAYYHLMMVFDKLINYGIHKFSTERTRSSSLLIIELPAIAAKVIDPASDEFPGANFIANT